MKILVIIPARGGSKGIPRKNVRNMAGKPLIYYAIKTALGSKFKPDVYVSTDDDEIMVLSDKFGAKTHKRPDSLGEDAVTLDPVIYDAVQHISRKENREYDLIATLQPTSPLLTSASFDKAVELFQNDSTLDTVISAMEDSHLRWNLEDGKYVPGYTKRLNRQQLPPQFKETGGFLISRASSVSRDNRIGQNVELSILKNGEEIDIDTSEDWSICEYILNKKHIVFVVAGYNEIGLGHVYRTLLLANEITSHRITFLVTSKSQLAFDKISSLHYHVVLAQSENLLNEVLALNPDIVINDMLDTEENYVSGLKKNSCQVVNFEDLGPGSFKADIIINALYHNNDSLPHHYYGHEYFCARDEFLYSSFKTLSSEIKKILITFGGCDENNLTKKVLDSIIPYCDNKSIEITVISGMGYVHRDSLKEYDQIEHITNTNRMSDYMLEADLIFTSAGRTVYEIACLGVPAIVLAQNKRELTHRFACKENGFLNLGLGTDVSMDELEKAFLSIAEDRKSQQKMHSLMLEKNLRQGKQRVVNLILDQCKVWEESL